jgi:hypothetical protein
MIGLNRSPSRSERMVNFDLHDHRADNSRNKQDGEHPHEHPLSLLHKVTGAGNH